MPAVLENLIVYFEEKYQCAGFCDQALFFYSLPITEGPPSRSCLEPFLDEIEIYFKNFGAVMIVTGVLLLSMTCCACPVSRYKKNQVS